MYRTKYASGLLIAAAFPKNLLNILKNLWLSPGLNLDL
jgi:hypothetical protein